MDYADAYVVALRYAKIRSTATDTTLLGRNLTAAEMVGHPTEPPTLNRLIAADAAAEAGDHEGEAALRENRPVVPIMGKFVPVNHPHEFLDRVAVAASHRHQELDPQTRTSFRIRHGPDGETSATLRSLEPRPAPYLSFGEDPFGYVAGMIRSKILGRQRIRHNFPSGTAGLDLDYSIRRLNGTNDKHLAALAEAARLAHTAWPHPLPA